MQAYILGDVLGKGQFGTVVNATHAATREKVAIKFATDTALGHRAMKVERNVYARLQNTPGFCEVHTYGIHEGRPFLVLSQLAEPLNETTARRYGIKCVAHQMLRRVQALHAVGVVHRDVSPTNFMFNEKRDLVMLDFGLCGALPTEDTDTRVPIGTSRFASLRVLSAKCPTRKDDVEACLNILRWLSPSAKTEPWKNAIRAARQGPPLDAPDYKRVEKYVMEACAHDV